MNFAYLLNNPVWFFLATGVYLFFYIMFVVSVAYKIGDDPTIVPIIIIGIAIGAFSIFFWPVLLPVELAICLGIIFARKLK